jgi:ribonuclease P protein component
MKKVQRLIKDSEFQQVRSEGKSSSHPFMLLFARPNGLTLTRFGFVVSKRVGKATVRNRVKRLMRESIRTRVLGISSGWDIVLVARKPSVGRSYWEIAAAVEELFRRSHLVDDLGPTAGSPH